MEEINDSKQRSSNFELLRVVLILMVIVLHYCNEDMGGLLKNAEKGTVNFYIAHFIKSFSIIAVNVFIIITGYFSYKKTSVKICKPINLYVLSIFYGVIIVGIVIFFTKPNFNMTLINDLSIAIFSRWFVVIYCILYLLIPFINKLVSNLNEKQFKTLLIINMIFFYLWHTFFTDTTIVDGGYGIINFINMYMIGAYIAKFKDKPIVKSKSFLIYICCTLLTAIYSFFAGRAWAYCTIFNLISSIAFFEFFRGIKIKNSKIINKLATYTFAVYIIHENSFLRNILFRKIFKSDLFWNSNYMLLHLIITVISIYIICVFVEFIRRCIFNKIIDDKIKKIKYEINLENKEKLV